jgi:hypothetical protein
MLCNIVGCSLGQSTLDTHVIKSHLQAPHFALRISTGKASAMIPSQQKPNRRHSQHSYTGKRWRLPYTFEAGHTFRLESTGYVLHSLGYLWDCLTKDARDSIAHFLLR